MEDRRRPFSHNKLLKSTNTSRRFLILRSKIQHLVATVVHSSAYGFSDDEENRGRASSVHTVLTSASGPRRTPEPPRFSFSSELDGKLPFSPLHWRGLDFVLITAEGVVQNAPGCWLEPLLPRRVLLPELTLLQRSCTDRSKPIRTILDDPGRPRTTTDAHGRSWTTTDDHGQSRMTTDAHGRSWTTTDDHERSWTTTDDHGQSWTTTNAQ
ncbi:hypothetical protein FQA47_018656 [Oryzias melastigma]|uniref:Uncharacterized protein n=1 Tax=Oryzias melastigma TaxID=30732 RepID=A0A834BND4_ORYME|nr:hypothetical protein FQA47_018656 [Oryzias melastigma]